MAMVKGRSVVVLARRVFCPVADSGGEMNTEPSKKLAATTTVRDETAANAKRRLDILPRGS